MELSRRRTVERRAIRMRQMMHRLNVDALALLCVRGGEAVSEARSKCALCDQSDQCLRWLDRDYGGSAAPDFCPLFLLFSSCRLRASQYFADLPRMEAAVG